MCEGFFMKEARDWKKIRTMGWIVYCGYADPKNAPSSMESWWPLEGDIVEKPKRTTKARQAKIDNIIAQTLQKLN